MISGLDGIDGLLSDADALQLAACLRLLERMTKMAEGVLSSLYINFSAKGTL